MNRHWRVPLFAVAAALLSCAGGDAPPVALDTKNDVCASCRMPVSDARLAAQLASPGEEPKFFDDIGCLADLLKRGDPPREGSVADVADHRTGDWVRASRASYSRCAAVETPMGSHLVAHADTSSRDQDPVLRGCVPTTQAEIFGPNGPPDGKKKG